MQAKSSHPDSRSEYNLKPVYDLDYVNDKRVNCKVKTVYFDLSLDLVNDQYFIPKANCTNLEVLF
jgi:hypothetical protein